MAATEIGNPVHIRLGEHLQAVDNFAAEREITRAAAARQLIEDGLAGHDQGATAAESDIAEESIIDPALPKWRQLERVDARFRADQLIALKTLTRQRARDRRNRQERITDNTLLRVAVDLLFAHADRLQGDTEGELRASVLPRGRGSR